jgi:hypothetical protein
MRSIGFIILAVTMTGCTIQQRVNLTAAPVVPVAYRAASAGVLAFDPPALAGTPRIDLSRDDRGNTAFAGYADSSTTFYSVSVDNEQGDLGGIGFGCGSGGQGSAGAVYDRHSISQTFGSSYR